MIVVGGIYQERCLTSDWDQIFGSAGRAACILSGVFGLRVGLHGWYSKEKLGALKASFAPYSVDMHIRTTHRHCIFDYQHPLSLPSLRRDNKAKWQESHIVKSDLVLLFGSLEGLPTVKANKLVFDPQNEPLEQVFSQNRISARQIAVIANENEVRIRHSLSTRENINLIFGLSQAISVVVVKCGIFGALVFERRKRAPRQITPYRSARVFKIGSGDAFSAAFAFMWCSRSLGAWQSADYASRTVACYVNDPSLNFTIAELRQVQPIRIRRKAVQVYLAGPFFTLADMMMLVESRRALSNLGVKVFSPLHQVGTRGNRNLIAKKDLAGLRKSDAVLALLHNSDPGTIFEVGYARSEGIPVVALCEHTKEEDLTMLEGANCQIETDFCSALYKAAWAGME